MTSKQTHITFSVLMALVFSLIVHASFQGVEPMKSPIKVQNTNRQSHTDLSTSASKLIFHTKMVVHESLILTKESLNTILDTVIETL